MNLSNLSNGVENVINILESSLRSSPDSGIGEDTKENMALDEKETPTEVVQQLAEDMASVIVSDAQTDKESGGSLKENPSDIEPSDSLNQGHETNSTTAVVEDVSIEKDQCVTSTNTTAAKTENAVDNDEGNQPNQHMISNCREGQKDSTFWKSLHNLSDIDTIDASMPKSEKSQEESEEGLDIREEVTEDEKNQHEENKTEKNDESEEGLDIREEVTDDEKSLPEENQTQKNDKPETGLEEATDEDNKLPEETKKNEECNKLDENIQSEETNATKQSNNVEFDQDTLNGQAIQKTELVMRRTPHPMTRVETLKKQESEDVTVFSLQSLKPQCDTPAEDKEDPEEDEELRKLSWDSDSDERADLGLEDGTAMKVQVRTTLYCQFNDFWINTSGLGYEFREWKVSDWH